MSGCASVKAHRKKAVLLVHGVMSLGGWQRTARRALEPHFRCVRVRYPHYWLMGVEAVVEPLILAAAVAALVRSTRGHSTRWSLLVWIVGSLLGIWVAYRARAVRRSRAIRFIKRRIDPEIQFDRRPSVIAHSMGTLLLGDFLQRYREARFGRIVLVGSVMDSRYDWESVALASPPSVEAVRNEVSQEDGVVSRVQLARRFIAGLGDSGISGFRPSRAVHPRFDAVEKCPRCRHGRIALVHNPVSPHGTHDHWEHGVSHACNVWLPFL